jgi:hypothetical protein
LIGVSGSKAPNLALNDTLIRAAKPRGSSWKLADEKGLFLPVTPSGGKLWKLKYRIASKEKKLALGAYPHVGLAAARKLRDAARATIAAGQDPSLERKKAKFAARLSADVTFASVANEYIDTKMVGDQKAPATISKARWILEQLALAIGTMSICEPLRSGARYCT